MWGPASHPAELRSSPPEGLGEAGAATGHLRSVDHVTGYSIQASDDSIGHIEEFIVDDSTWFVRYLVVDTRNWLPGGRKVLIAPTWVSEVNWGDKAVKVALTKKQIEESPEYDPSKPVNRAYEVRLYDFYGRPHYWER